MTDAYRIGVIGGSGLYSMEGLHIEEERRIDTPWGDASDAYLLGTLDGQRGEDADVVAPQMAGADDADGQARSRQAGRRSAREAVSRHRALRGGPAWSG